MKMKLSKWAKENGVTYRTAWTYHKNGKLITEQLPSGTIVVLGKRKAVENTVIYARVSSSENKENLERQAERLTSYCAAKGWVVFKTVKEIGNGLNDQRKQLEKLLLDRTVTRIVVEHKDRLARFGLNYIEQLLALDDREIVVINNQVNDKDDLMQDFVSIITSFTARLYGLRRSKRKTEKIIEELQNK